MSRRVADVPEGQRKLAGDFSHRITRKKGCVPAGTPEDSGLPSTHLWLHCRVVLGTNRVLRERHEKDGNENEMMPCMSGGPPASLPGREPFPV